MLQRRYNQHTCSLLFLLIFSAMATGCVVTDPQMLFDPCVSAATVGMEPDQAKEITCDLKPDTLLVASPSGTAPVEELVRKGLARIPAEAVSQSGLAGSRWCFLAPQDSARGTAVCVDSHTPIERLFVVRGRRIRLVLRRDGGAAASVANIHGSDTLNE